MATANEITNKMTLKLELEKLIEKVGLKHYTRSLGKNPELLQQVVKATAFLPDTAKLPERVWNIINDQTGFKCKRGNDIKFNTIVKGYYGFCEGKCACKREHVATIAANNYANMSDEEKQKIRKKIEATNIERYGSKSSSANPLVKEKREKTTIERYGVTNYTLSQEGKNKVSEKYHSLSDDEKKARKQKAIETNLQKYGTENTMHIARQAFLDQNGGKNPFQIDEYDEKRRQTMLKTHGTVYPLKNKEILKKMCDDNFEKYGTKNIMQSQSLKDQNNEQFGRDFLAQKHISDKAYEILQCKEKLQKALLDEKSTVVLAKKMGIGYATLFNYLVKYNLEIEKTKSSYETEICDFLKNDCGLDILENDRKIISPQELDIVVPSHKLAIEVCGLYWHSEKHKQDSYHINKLKATNAAGYKLITIFEDEYLFKKDIVFSRLKNLLNISQKGFGARKLVINEISWSCASDFLIKHHIQERGTFSKLCYGAFNGSELVAVMTFTPPNIAKGSKNSDFYELNRFATDGRNHSGVASKLLKHFRKNNNDKDIISYADLRWSEGNLYEKLGFTHDSTTVPNYFYVKGNKRYNRWKFRKSEIVHLVENGNEKTERDIMLELDYYRIYDCGNKKYLLKS